MAVTKTNPRTQLTKIADGIRKAQEAFASAYEQYADFKAESLLDLDREIQTKEEEFKARQNEMAQTEKDLQIAMDQRMKEYGLKAAQEVAKKQDRLLVEMSDYIKLENQALDNEQAIEELTESLQKKYADEKAIAMNSLAREKELEHAAATAQALAKIEQLEAQLLSANEMIDDLRREVANQRQLTKEVAEAGKQGAIVQNMGKS